jgi:hypothetical protein
MSVSAVTLYGESTIPRLRQWDTKNGHSENHIYLIYTQIQNYYSKSVKVRKIQELFVKERQWMTAQMQMHIREVNSMFAVERKKVCERYKEYDGCYLGHYAQWFFWFFFTIGIFVVAGGIGMMIAQNYGK